MTLVSAIMPTRGRNVWAALALDSFLRQTYPDKQLIILDDNDDPSFREPVLQFGNVAYLRTDTRMSIPAKRNACCRFAPGGILMHFDSDDWSDPRRMADQVRRLDESGKAVSGYHSMLFVDEVQRQAYRYTNHADYAVGTSLAYRKTWWMAHPFNENLKAGEDNESVRAAQQQRELITSDAGCLMVARIHDGNTDPKHLSGAQLNFRSVPIDTIPPAFFGGLP